MLSISKSDWALFRVACESLENHGKQIGIIIFISYWINCKYMKLNVRTSINESEIY